MIIIPKFPKGQLLGIVRRAYRFYQNSFQSLRFVTRAPSEVAQKSHSILHLYLVDLKTDAFLLANPRPGKE